MGFLKYLSGRCSHGKGMKTHKTRPSTYSCLRRLYIPHFHFPDCLIGCLYINLRREIDIYFFHFETIYSFDFKENNHLVKIKIIS